MNTRLKLRSTLLILLIIHSAILSSCTQTPGNSQNKADEEYAEDVVTYIEPQGLLNTRASIGQLTLDSELVVIARVVSEDEVINIARDGTTEDKLDPDLYGIGQLYKIEINDVLSGAGKPQYVVQYRGEIVGDWRTIEFEQIKSFANNYSGTKLKVGVPYLFFLTKLYMQVERFSDGDIYAGTALPWVFDTSDPKQVRAVDIYDNSTYRKLLTLHFPPTSLDEMLEMIAHPKDYLTPIPPLPTQTFTPGPTREPTPYPPGFTGRWEVVAPTPYP